MKKQDLDFTQHIIESVAKHTGVSEKEILSSRRTARIASARQISMWLMRWNTSLSMQAIARLHGKENHGTVIWASQQVEGLMQVNPAFRQLCNEIKESIKS